MRADVDTSSVKQHAYQAPGLVFGDRASGRVLSRDLDDRALTRAAAPGFERSALLPRLIVFGVLIASALLDEGQGHHQGHWILLVGYAVSTLALAAASWRTPLNRVLPWLSTILDALLAVYVIAEHLPVQLGSSGHPSDAVSQLPAFLFLLQTGLRLRYDHTILFASVVAVGWAIAMALDYGAMANGSPISGTGLTHQLFSLVAFVAAAAFVIHGVRRMRLALAAELRAEREKAYLARFVPADLSVDVVRAGRRNEVRKRHVSLMAVDIRGFSALTRIHDQAEVLSWLLEMRYAVNQIVTAHDGLIDKYIGDGILALFLEGPPQQQADRALAAGRAIHRHVKLWNEQRVSEDLPPLRVIVALHTGEVLAGVFDDGLRAEFTVLGPAMNALSRIERRAKEDDLDLVASKRFVRLLDQSAYPDLNFARLDRRDTDFEIPDVFAVDVRPPVHAFRVPELGHRTHHLEPNASELDATRT